MQVTEQRGDSGITEYITVRPIVQLLARQVGLVERATQATPAVIEIVETPVNVQVKEAVEEIKEKASELAAHEPVLPPTPAPTPASSEEAKMVTQTIEPQKMGIRVVPKIFVEQLPAIVRIEPQKSVPLPEAAKPEASYIEVKKTVPAAPVAVSPTAAAVLAEHAQRVEQPPPHPIPEEKYKGPVEFVPKLPVTQKVVEPIPATKPVPPPPAAPAETLKEHALKLWSQALPEKLGSAESRQYHGKGWSVMLTNELDKKTNARRTTAYLLAQCPTGEIKEATIGPYLSESFERNMAVVFPKTNAWCSSISGNNPNLA